MAYKALYRIYRPQTFDEVVGQKHILRTLQNAIKEKVKTATDLEVKEVNIKIKDVSNGETKSK